MKLKFIFATVLLFSNIGLASTFVPTKILTSCDMSLASCTSIGVDINQQISYAIQATFTGAPVGTLILQISSDDVLAAPGPNPGANVVNWATYTGSTEAVTAAGTFVWNVFPAGYRWVRMVYTKTSGIGSISATFDGKH